MSHLLRLLALLSSVSAGGVVVASDLALASTPRVPAPEPVAVLQADKKESPEIKPTRKPAAKRKPRMDFGRFEGY